MEKISDSEVSSDFSSEVVLLAHQTINGYEIADRWAGEGRYWVYVQIPRQKIKEILQKELENTRKLATDHYQAGSQC